MAKTAPALNDRTHIILQTMGQQIKLARLRRNLPQNTVAQMANITRSTVINVENGNPNTSIAAYAAVLHVLDNMDEDLLKLAQKDTLGQALMDSRLPKRARTISG